MSKPTATVARPTYSKKQFPFWATRKEIWLNLRWQEGRSIVFHEYDEKSRDNIVALLSNAVLYGHCPPGCMVAALGHILVNAPQAWLVPGKDSMVQALRTELEWFLEEESVDLDLVLLCSGRGMATNPMQEAIAALGKHFTAGGVQPPTIAFTPQMGMLVSMYPIVDTLSLYTCVLNARLHRAVDAPCMHDVDSTLFATTVTQEPGP